MRFCNNCRREKPVEEFYPSYRTQCRDCLKIKAAVHREEKLLYLRQWRAQHPLAYKEWYAENEEHKKAEWQAWYAENREERLQYLSEWSKANSHVVTAIRVKRRAAKKNVMVQWADHDAIREIYRMAAEMTAATGIEHHVDHIVPLQGKTVCGLHWENNLQVLPAVDNIRKGNRLIGANL